MKQKIFIFFFFFIFLFSLNNINAIASFNSIPDAELSFNDFKSIDLGNYCHSTNINKICEPTSYQINFLNPDTGKTISFLGYGEHSNSYFMIRLINGQISISSNSKNSLTLVNVLGADTPYSSQDASESFFINIDESQAPVQIATIAPASIYGNQTKTYQLGDFFLLEDKFSISYEDSLLVKSVFLDSSQYQNTAKCSVGEIKVCLSSYSGILSITGLNNVFNKNIFITAYNENGQITTKIPVEVTPYETGATNELYNSYPKVTPQSFAPIHLNTGNSEIGIRGYNAFNSFFEYYPYIGRVGEVKEINMDNYFSDYDSLFVYINSTDMVLNANYTFWNNYSYDNMNWTQTICSESSCTNATFTQEETNVTTGLSALLWELGFENINMTQDVNFSNPSSLGTSEIVLNFPNIFYINSQFVETNLTLWIGACNNFGCVTHNEFGEKLRIEVFIENKAPHSLIPQSIAPLYINFGETKSFNINEWYSDFNKINIYWKEGANSFSLTNPSTDFNTQIYNSPTTGLPIYQVKLYSDAIISVTATNIEHNFNIQIEACNFEKCINGTTYEDFGLVTNYTLGVFIGNTTKLLSSQIDNSQFRDIFNLILGLFPESEDLTSIQKTNFAFISIITIVSVIMFLGFSNDMDISSMKILLFVSLGMGALTFIFFTFKGYISPVILAVISLISIGIIYFKFSNGGGNG